MELRASVEYPRAGYLVFHFGDWTVLKYHYLDPPSLTEEELDRCVSELDGEQTPEGFPVLSGDLPRGLALAKAGEHAGPELMIGDLEPGVLLFPGTCRVAGSFERDISGPGGAFASWCLSDQMRIHVYDDTNGEFIEALQRDLEVRHVQIAT